MILYYLLWLTLVLYLISKELRDWTYLALEVGKYKSEERSGINQSEGEEDPLPESVKHMYS